MLEQIQTLSDVETKGSKKHSFRIDVSLLITIILL